MVAATVNIIDPLAGGTYTVGTGGNYPSLTNTGGIFEAINSAGLTGNITIDVISNLSGELGTHPLNGIAGGFSVTLKPSGAARVISGTSTGTGLIKLNGADNITIDGSLSGGTDQSLTITNGNAGATVIWIASASASDGANGNTVKNCILSGNTGTTIIAGVLAGSGTTFGGDAETANSNNTIQNNQIFRVQNAAFIRGNGTALDQNWLVTGNNWGSTVAADKLLFRGMLIGNAQNFNVTNNVINGVSSSAVTSSTMSGIQIALVVNGGSVRRNKISDIKHNNTAGWGSNGIYITSSSTASNVTIANNFISDVASQGFNGVADTDNGYGIVVALGGGYNIYHNSILLNTNQGANAATGITAAVNVLTGLAAGAVDLRDNVLVSTQTLGTRYGVISSSANTVFSNINYNDYFAQNVGFIGGSARQTLANWQTGTGQDANSLAVDPLFITSTAPADLHLQSTSPMVGAGFALAAVTDDFDNDPRPAANPDIGADELVQSTAGTIAAGTYYNVRAAGGDSLGGNVTVTNILYLNGTLNTGANTLTIDCNASVSGASPTSFVIGNLQKNFCNSGVKGFEVGTANGYSPVSVNVTAGTFPATFTVRAVQGPHPAFPHPEQALQRYWTLTATGVTSADLNFNYLDPTDIPVTANENIFVIFKHDGSFSMPGGSVNPATNEATITGVTSFSDWTVAQPNAPTAANGTVAGRIVADDGSPVAGVVIRMEGTQSRKTITNADGNYSFANVETNGFYTVTPAHVNFRFSPNQRSFGQLAERTEAPFTGSRIPGGPNVIATPEFFVRQHYLDFLGREPDEAGFNFWTNEILSCGDDLACIERRTINVSAAYFKSIEFSQTGGLVDRLYHATYGRRPQFAEFTSDHAIIRRDVIVGRTGWEEQLRSNKSAFVSAWIQRAAFQNAYDGLTNAEFVDRLLSNAKLIYEADERQQLLVGLSDGSLTRGEVLQRIAEDQRFIDARFNESFVMMEYFGYLRRDPDEEGFRFWVNKLNQFNGNFEQAEMVKAFINSIEFRNRFVSQ